MIRRGEMQQDLERLAGAIRARRQERGLTLTALAKSIRSSSQQQCNVEKAHNWPSMPAYIAMCRKLEAGKIPLLDLP